MAVVQWQWMATVTEDMHSSEGEGGPSFDSHHGHHTALVISSLYLSSNKRLICRPGQRWKLSADQIQL